MKCIKQVFFVLLLAFAGSFSAFGQEYVHPNYLSKTVEEVELLKITITPEYTKVDFVIETTNDYAAGGWACAMPNFHILDKHGTKYPLQRAENIPICPERHDFTGPNQRLRFTLYFDPLPPTLNLISILEDHPQGFNFKVIILKPVA